jgi:hypothetical protein
MQATSIPRQYQTVLDQIEATRKRFGTYPKTSDPFILIERSLNFHRRIYSQATQDLKNALKEAVSHLELLGHDCHASQEDGCAGCQKIEQLKDEYSSIH